jgi:hypothetical protein
VLDVLVAVIVQRFHRVHAEIDVAENVQVDEVHLD